MKIAISAQGKGAESPMDPRFGRCQGFVVYDTDSGAFDYVDNAGQANLPQGAGIQSAQVVADTGATQVITGRVGPKASDALEKAGVSVFFSEQNTVQQALDEYRQSGAGGRPPVGGGQSGDDPGCRRMGGGGRGMGGGGGRGMGGGGGRGAGGGGGRGAGGGGGRGMGGGGRGMNTR
jgi:predicted Fe-Mo cluster-binding NifX family protein